jgi:hypothetical protein
MSRSEIDIASFRGIGAESELVTQQLGSLWLDQCSTALFKVPAATAPEASNYLINPGHADSRLCSIVGSLYAAIRQAAAPAEISFKA